MRVHQLAKEYDKKSTEFVDIIQGYGIDVNSHLSGLTDDEVSIIRKKLDKQVGGDREFQTYSDEDRLEEEPKKDDWTLGKEDSTIEPPKVGISSEEAQEALATNIKAAGEAREEYAKTSKAISEDPENWASLASEVVSVDRCTSDDEESDSELSFGQKAFAKAEEETKAKKIEEVPEVIVEKPSGIFGWLKGLFS